MRRGNCYVTCEALYHLLGGRASGWTPRTVRHEGDVHWYLVRRLVRGVGGRNEAPVLMPIEIVLDPTASQFKTEPPYHLGRGRGFLTKRPSKRARELMKKLVWQGT